MALEAVLYAQQPQDPFGYGSNKDLYNYNLLASGGSGNWGFGDFILEKEEDQGSMSFLENQTENYSYGDWNNCLSPPPMLPHMNVPNSNPCSEATTDAATSNTQNLDTSTSTNTRPKRRRARSRKNKEEIENQRMTHIAVERNRRKQMNEYLSVLRSLMPDSYVQRVLSLASMTFFVSTKTCFIGYNYI